MTAAAYQHASHSEPFDVARRAASARLSSHEAQATHAWIAVATKALGGRLPDWAGAALRGIDPSAVEAAREALEIEYLPEWLTSEHVAFVFETHLSERDRGSLRGRRHTGAYFTPPKLIDLVVEQTLRPMLEDASTPDAVLGLRILDPAVGAGGFLLSAARLLTDRLMRLGKGHLTEAEARRAVVAHCLYGADANPIAALLTCAILNSFANAHGGLDVHVRWADSILPPTLIATAGIGGAPALDVASLLASSDPGFDAIVGNPPWGTVKPAIRQFFAHVDPSVLHWQGADLRTRVVQMGENAARWNNHADQVRSYAKALRTAGYYQHQGRGDADLYRYFVERAYRLLRPPGGRIGFLVPGAFLRADGPSPLRNHLFETGSFDCILEFINTERLFDIHSMFRFVMLIWARGEASGVSRVGFGVRNLQEAHRVLRDAPTKMTLAFLDRVGGQRRTVPDVRSTRSADLLRRLYDQHPMLEEPGCDWTPRFVRELDMTNDSHHFVHSADIVDTAQVAPLYEGRMVHQFDNRAKRYDGGNGRRAAWSTQGLGERPISPHFFIPIDLAARVSGSQDRAGFCDVTGHANERTVLAAMIPSHAAAGNKVPTVRFDEEGSEPHLIWLALANSLVIDWVARRRVATSLNFFQLAQLPFPRIDATTNVGARIVDLASQLSRSVEKWTLDALRMRSMLRASLDALIAECFELDLSDLAFLLGDFPLLDRHQPPMGQLERSTITRDLVLHTYAQTLGLRGITLEELGGPTDCGPSDVAERVAAAHESGQIAYIPGEAAKRLWSDMPLPLR